MVKFLTIRDIPKKTNYTNYVSAYINNITFINPNKKKKWNEWIFYFGKFIAKIYVMGNMIKNNILSIYFIANC